MGSAQFCDVCGKILEIKTTKEKTFGICKCGYVKEIEDSVSVSEKGRRKQKVGKGVAEAVVEKGFPHICKKCGFGECEVYDLGASWSDESNIYLFKCKKCGFVERQADGSSNK